MPLEVRGEPVAGALRRRDAVRLAGGIAVDLVLCALAACVASLGVGLRWDRDRLVRVGLWLCVAAAVAAAAAVGSLLGALLTGDTGLLYVAENWSAGLSVPYRIAAVWAGAQGSLLLWVFLLLAATAAVAASAVHRRGEARADRSTPSAAAPSLPAGRRPDLSAPAALVMACVTLCLSAVLALDPGSDPFAPAPPGAVPAGLEPLLLHPAMALHPPALFVGYVALTVPFAYALAALARGEPTISWVRSSRGWALVGWAFLSLGIGLGAWWAYVILSWGGYWGWDPVENSSLAPWLAATALLHSFVEYRRAPAFRRWAACLAPLTFWFTVVAAWTTRTGLVSSVHAFARRPLLVVVLSVLLVAVAVVSAALLAWRWRALAGLAAPGSASGPVTDGRADPAGRSEVPAGVGTRAAAAGPSQASRLSQAWDTRDTLHVLLNVMLTASAAALTFGTVVAPLALRQTVRAGTYEMVARPLGVLVVLGVGVCALVGRPVRMGRRPVDRLAVPVAAAVVGAIVVGVAGRPPEPRGLIAAAVCSFTAAAVLQSIWLRAALPTTGCPGVGLRSRLRRVPWGAVLAHAGVAVVLAGLVGAGMYDARARLELPAEEGAAGSLESYRLAIAGLEVGSAPQGGERIAVRFDVERDGRPAGTVSPALDYYSGSGGSGRTVARADIAGSAWRDLVVSPVAFAVDGIVVDVVVVPLVRFIWAGTGLLVLGGLVALWPRRKSAGPARRVAVGADREGADGCGSPAATTPEGTVEGHGVGG